MPNDAEAVFRALAHHSRRRLLEFLRSENGQPLGRLCGQLGISRQAGTRHLAVLERAALVVVQWEGRQKRHLLNPAPLHEVAERWIGTFRRG